MSAEDAALEYLDGRNASTQSVADKLRCTTVSAKYVLKKLEKAGKVRSWKVNKELWWNVT